ncbi:MAG TPA: alanine--tRNA ligase [Gemmataceae bacterium]|nr:alanine--tRNA ligase [Gemmataceae bacterium]
MLTANEIRQQFIDFFVKKHGHTAVPSSSVVPHGDDTLLFTNAGMNQFKDVFLGTGSRPYKRAVDTQKCIRAGGKHNDLDDVGKDTYHHTFFEMLGNWSFGDYFKREAIAWAWELLTKDWGLDKSRLHATVFGGDAAEGLARDDEAAELWRTVTDIDPAHIHWGSKKDNFWEMGETGPCGPCTEIHIDRTPDKTGGELVNKGRAEVIEIWNLVFIQFNRAEDRTLTPLPAKHVDTGMGFERVTAVLQDKSSNYDTDVFTPIMEAIGSLVGKKYGGSLGDRDDIAFRVIADHLRMLTFAMSDGALPDNKGRGAVVRSVLRRAFRFGYQRFDQREPFIYKLVPTLVAHMGEAYPDLRKNPERVMEIIKREESDFLRTIQRGLDLFERYVERARAHASGVPVWSGPGYTEVEQEEMPKHFIPDTEKYWYERAGKNVIPGEATFKLHTTSGFPPDLTMQMAEEYGLSVDMAKYHQLMKGHEIISRGEDRGPLVMAVEGELPATDDSPKYGPWMTEATVLGWMQGKQVVRSGRLEANQDVALLLDRTNFYAEQGGQVADTGTIRTPTGQFRVNDTRKLGDSVLHIGRVVDGHLEEGQKAKLGFDLTVRSDTMRNHTATHLLNWALRKVLGGDIEQRGSLVDPDKTRFDFTYQHPLASEEIAEVERLVNEKIYSDLPVNPVVMPLAEAKKIPGVRAVFGEKYPDPVRVLLIGAEKPFEVTPEHSVEFCGGTHLTHTGQAGFCKIVSQEAVGKGVRRVTAVTGREAVATVQRMASVIDEMVARFNCKPAEVASRIDALQEEIKKLQQQLKKGAAGDLQSAADKLLAGAQQVGGARVIVGEMPAGPDEAMRTQVDRLKQTAGSAVVVVGWTDDGKVGLLAAASDDLVKKGLHAGKLVGQVAAVVGGKGGGKPTMAQAGGKEPAKLSEALQLALKLAKEQLGG